jgi:hypothetical protein
MPDYQIKNIDERYNREMLQILRASPIKAGGLQICFDKQPHIFTQSSRKYFLTKHVGLFESDSLKGFGSVGFYDAMVSGSPEPVFYYHNFYVLPEARGHNFILNAGLHFLQDNSDPNIAGFSIAMKGNKPVESYFDDPAAKRIMQVQLLDSLVIKNIIFSFPKRNNSGYKVRQATDEDVPEIVQLLRTEYSQRLFGNHVTPDNFLPSLNLRGLSIHDYFLATSQNGRIVGVSAAWDCSSFRQTRVLKYSKNFWPDLLGYNLLSAFLPMAPFPKPGDCFKELTVVDYAVEDRNPAIMHALLCEIYRFYRSKNFHYINWGSCGSDPLLKAASGFWHRTTTSNIVLIKHPAKYIPDHALRLPYVDIAFL